MNRVRLELLTFRAQTAISRALARAADLEATVNALETAERLVAIRDAARRLLGNGYHDRVKPWRDFIRECCANWNCEPLEVGLRLNREGAFLGDGLPIAFFAATLDLVEEFAARPESKPQ